MRFPILSRDVRRVRWGRPWFRVWGKRPGDSLAHGSVCHCSRSQNKREGIRKEEGPRGTQPHRAAAAGGASRLVLLLPRFADDADVLEENRTRQGPDRLSTAADASPRSRLDL